MVLLALQEVSQLASSEQVDSLIKKDNFDYVLLEQLRQLANEDYQFVCVLAHFANYEEGVAIMTKYTITDFNSGKTRKIVKLTMDFNGKEVMRFSCHLG